jgi:hypothetical protein
VNNRKFRVDQDFTCARTCRSRSRPAIAECRATSDIRNPRSKAPSAPPQKDPQTPEITPSREKLHKNGRTSPTISISFEAWQCAAHCIESKESRRCRCHTCGSDAVDEGEERWPERYYSGTHVVALVSGIVTFMVVNLTLGCARRVKDQT